MIVPSFLGRCKQKQRGLRGLLCRWPSITEWEMHITAQGPRLRNDLYCVEWDVKLYHTIPFVLYCYSNIPFQLFSKARLTFTSLLYKAVLLLSTGVLSWSNNRSSRLLLVHWRSARILSVRYVWRCIFTSTRLDPVADTKGVYVTLHNVIKTTQRALRPAPLHGVGHVTPTAIHCRLISP